MKSKLANLMTLIGSIVAQVAIVWQSTTGTTYDKLAASLLALLALLVAKSKLAEVEHVVLLAVTVLGTVGLMIFSHLTPGSKAATIGSVALALITSLRTLLLSQGVSAKAVALLLVGGSLLASTPARAQGVLPDPFAGKCFGNACLTLEGGFSALGVIMTGADKGKLQYGVNVNAGYALLFGYDQWWASGPSVHGALQSGTDPATNSTVTSLDVMAGVTLARYGHLGVEKSFLSSGPALPYVFVMGLVAPVDLMTPTGIKQKQMGAMIAGAGSK